MSLSNANAVVVITGASSGIGRAAAHAFAKRGASLVLAARREQRLRLAAEECLARGAPVTIAPTDVTSLEAVEALARHAIETFGRIDVWVNNAGVSLFARFEEAPVNAYRQVIETNLFGTIHGARVALRQFRKQGRGVLINNASMAAYVGQPYTSAYVASKFAIRGLSESLRQEVRDAPDIHVCTVLPASIDTPIFQHAANYTGRMIKPVPPVYDPAAVAETFVRLTERPQREVFVGLPGRLVALEKKIAPGMAERLMARTVEKRHFQNRSAPASAGNLFEPMHDEYVVDGGWRARRRPWRRIAVGLALAAIPVGMAVSRRGPSA